MSSEREQHIELLQRIKNDLESCHPYEKIFKEFQIMLIERQITESVELEMNIVNKICLYFFDNIDLQNLDIASMMLEMITDYVHKYGQIKYETNLQYWQEKFAEFVEVLSK